MSEQQITQEAQESLQPINDTTLIQMKKARKAKWMRAKQINKDGSPKRVKSRKTHKSPKTEMRRGSVDMEPSMLQGKDIFALSANRKQPNNITTQSK